MRDRNDGISESNILQNQFTAYLIVALRRTRVHFIKAQASRMQKEVPLDITERRTLSISYEVSQYSHFDDDMLWQSLDQAKPREIYILFSKILEEKTFGEIAGELGVSLKTVASAYYRAIEKLKRELGGEEK